MNNPLLNSQKAGAITDMVYRTRLRLPRLGICLLAVVFTLVVLAAAPAATIRAENSRPGQTPNEEQAGVQTAVQTAAQTGFQGNAEEGPGVTGLNASASGAEISGAEGSVTEASGAAFSPSNASTPGSTPSVTEGAASVLLLYDSLGNGTPQAGGIAALERLAAAFEAGVTVVSLDNYEPGMLQRYDKVMAVFNSESAVSASFEKDLRSYTGGYLQIGGELPGFLKSRLQVSTRTVRGEPVHLMAAGGLDITFNVERLSYIESSSGAAYGKLTFESVPGVFPFSVQSGGITYVPFFEAGKGGELAMAGVLKEWFHQTQPGRAYLLIKEVYPFSDLSLLKYMADQLYEAGLPYIVSVRPVFSHTEYPAMQRYLETLKYMQARGGSILVNVPEVMDGVQARQDELKSDMEGFIDVLAKAGVAPLGVGAEQYWSHDAEYTGKGLTFFDSSVLFPDVKPIYKQPLNTYRAFGSSLFSLTMAEMQQSFGDRPVEELPVNTAVTYDFPDNADGLKAMIAELKASWITFADYKGIDHEVKTGSSTVQSRNGAVLLNGETLNLNYNGSTVSQDYQYVQQTETSFRKLFRVQNTFFMVIIAFSLIFFGGLLLIGRRLYRRKFMK